MMQQIINNAEIEYYEKKSRFITRIYTVNSQKEMKDCLQEIIKKEKGATHNCYACRILTENNFIYEKKSDNGEPGGTAGAPMLGVLSGDNLINVLVVTTRYFGGIKLGSGGLVNAYQKGVKEVLKKCGKKPYEELFLITIVFPINQVSHADYLLKNSAIAVDAKDYQEKVSYKIKITAEKKMILLDIVNKINGTIEK